jgi:pimeloyl-ACP methyl ester carboxylesterase
MRALSRAIGFDRCAVWGFSGGGPHALACGALLDDLVAAVATIGSPAPFGAAGLDYFAGMRESVRADMKLFNADRAAWEREGDQQRDEVLALSAAELAEQWSLGAAPVDANALRGAFGGWLHRAVQVALKAGAEGWSEDDIAIFHSPWGFDPAAIPVPVKVWHGREDRFVPFGHGQWLARTIQAAQADLRDDDGHMNVAAARIGEVHEWLAQHL